MTDGTNQSVGDPFTNFFKALVAMCTNVDDVDLGEIEWHASTNDLKQMLAQFPKNRVYIYKRDDNFLMTSDPQGQTLSVHFSGANGFQFQVTAEPLVVGTTIRALATAVKNNQAYQGYVTLFDVEGDLVDLVQQQQVPETDTSTPTVVWGDIETELGSGTFGKVFKTTVNFKNGEGDIVVAKKVPSSNKWASYLLKKEIQIMQDVRNANIPYYAVQPVYGQYNPPVLAIEFSPYGDLSSKIAKFQGYPSCFWRIALQVAAVFWHMPKLNHRDIKPENILLFPSKGGSQINFKLADFGLATNDGSDVNAGSAPYQPPETRTHRKMTRKGDMFSLGVTILEMVLGKDEPAASVSLKACALEAKGSCTWSKGSTLISKHVNMMITQYLKAYPDTSGKGQLSTLAMLLTKMTQPNPTNRISFEDLFSVLDQYADQLLGGGSGANCPGTLVA